MLFCKKSGLLIWTGLVPCVMAATLFLISCNKGVGTQEETYTLQRGELEIDITEMGEVVALKSVNITSPSIHWRFGMPKISMIIPDGSEVRKGDTVALFDLSEAYKFMDDANSQMEIAKAELVKLKAEQELRIKELETDLKITNINYKIAEINLEQAKYESEVRKKEIQLQLNKSKINLNKAKSEIKNQKKIHKEEVLQSKLRIQQLQDDVNEAKETINKLTLVSPANGLAIIENNRRTDSKWQIGDQAWSGTSLIRLPDLSKLKVHSEINEVDVSKIKVGQQVEVKLDAFSERVYSGKVISIAILAVYKNRKKSNIKVFPVEILLDETSEELRPGISVSSKIIVDKIQNVLFVPKDAVFKDGAEDYVWVKSGGKFNKQIIVTGVSSTDFIIVEKGLGEGDEIAMQVPVVEQEKQEENTDRKN